MLVLPVLIISMDGTMLGFAVPHLSEALEPTSSQLLWIIDIYSFMLAGLLVTMGAVGDRIGRRRLLLIGAAAFTATSVMAAFAPSATALITARALLGLAGATLMPSTLSLIRNIFTNDAERQTAIALWASAFALGSAVGPILAGFLLDHFWWGSVFLAGVPVTVVLLITAPRLVPESRNPEPGDFDLLSAVLSMMAMIPTIFAVKSLAEHGASPVVGGSALVGVVSGFLFLRRQRTLSDPMIDMRLFQIPRFRRAIGANLVACFGFAGGFFFITQYFQLVLDMSALRSGLYLTPAVLTTIVLMTFAPSFVRRSGPFEVMTVGLVMGTIGFAAFMVIGVDTPAVVAAGAITLGYGGLSMTMTVAIDGIMAVIPPERAGAGASVSETGNELGIALGTALLGSVLTVIYRARIDQLTTLPSEVVEMSRETLGGAVLASEDLAEGAARLLLDTARSAFVRGLNVASVVATILIGATTVWTATALPRRRHARGAGSRPIVEVGPELAVQVRPTHPEEEGRSSGGTTIQP